MLPLLQENIDSEKLVDYASTSTRLRVSDLEKLKFYAKQYKTTTCGLMRAATETMLAELDQAAKANTPAASAQGEKQ